MSVRNNFAEVAWALCMALGIGGCGSNIQSLPTSSVAPPSTPTPPTTPTPPVPPTTPPAPTCTSTVPSPQILYFAGSSLGWLDRVALGSTPGGISGGFSSASQSYGAVGTIATDLQQSSGCVTATGGQTTITMPLYVVDKASGANGTGVTLDIYAVTEILTPTNIQVTSLLQNTIPLPDLTGGANSNSRMAITNTAIVVTTDQGEMADMVDKTTFGIKPLKSTVGGVIKNVLADDSGSIALITDGGFTSFDANGTGADDGGLTPALLQARKPVNFSNGSSGNGEAIPQVTMGGPITPSQIRDLTTGAPVRDLSGGPR